MRGVQNVILGVSSFCKMSKFFFPILIWACVASAGSAQTIRQIQSRMAKGNWDAARQMMIKVLRKDTADVEIQWMTAQWFYHADNPRRQIDSSYAYVHRALASYRKATERQHDRLKRQGLDESLFLAFKSRLDSAAFERSKQVNTVAGYDYFLARFASANAWSRALELRNEVAFLDALKSNSYQDFEAYYQRYPQSHRAAEARNRYEKLLYDAKTKDGRLQSFADFIRDYPNSPFRLLAEREVYELSTVMGDSLAFLSFLHHYPESPFRKSAVDLCYSIFWDAGLAPPEFLLNDSLRKVQQLNSDYWIPFFDKGKYGFMNATGQEVFAPSFSNIDGDYKCGMVEADVMITSEGLISRDGKKISPPQKIIEPMGLGFWKVGDSTCLRVVHVSVNTLPNECASDVQLIGNRFLWLKGSNTAGIYSLAGKLLLRGTWDDVTWIENVIVLTQLQKKTIITMQNMLQASEGLPVAPAHVYDDVQRIGLQRLVVRNGSLEGIIDSNGRFVVPLARQVLASEPFGLVRKIDGILYLDEVDRNFASLPISKYKQYRQWLSIDTHSESLLWDLRVKQFLPRADSSWFAGGLLFTRQADSLVIYLNSHNKLSFQKDQRVILIPSRDSVRAFFIDEGKLKKNVYAVTNGAKLFTTEFDQIESIDSGLFLVTRKGKKGVFTKDGKVLVAIEYDMLAFNQGRYWSTFKDKKFGLVNLETGDLLKPLSTRNVVILSKDLLVIYNKDKCGLTDWHGKVATAFDYDEVLPWSAKLIWVRKGFSWHLIDYESNKPIIANVKRINKWQDHDQSRIYQIQKDDFFGVVSNERGLVIPPVFSLVKNVGSLEQPLYLTDKEVEEAGLHVVIYYDANGKFIRKQVYEQQEFETTMCEEE